MADRTRQGNAPDAEKERYNWVGTGFIVRASLGRPALVEAMALRPEQHIILAQTVGYPGGR